MLKNQQKDSKEQPRKKLEHSKLLTYIDVFSWVCLSIALLLLLFNKVELGTYVQNIFAYVTTAYVSLRLGYTAKAGVENYQKIHNAYKELSEQDDGEDTDNSNG